jgi:hypothetical protein
MDANQAQVWCVQHQGRYQGNHVLEVQVELQLQLQLDHIQLQLQFGVFGPRGFSWLSATNLKKEILSRIDELRVRKYTVEKAMS